MNLFLDDYETNSESQHHISGANILSSVQLFCHTQLNATNGTKNGYTCLSTKATTSVDSQKLAWNKGGNARTGNECKISGQYSM